MEFKSAYYSTAANNVVSVTLDSGDVMSVPVDMGNRHYVALLQWLDADPTREVLAYAPPPRGFKPLSRAAFMFAMRKLGVTPEQVKALIASMPEDTEQQADAKLLAGIVFDEHGTFERNNPLLNTLVHLSPLTDEQVDTMWWVAEDIKW